MKRLVWMILCVLMYKTSYCWGFYAHKQINYLAVFLLPKEMFGYYKSNIDFLSEHAVDPDKRRYLVEDEGPRHYLDLDHYGNYPYSELPHEWSKAVEKFSEDSLKAHGIVPWWTTIMLSRLTNAFRLKDQAMILKLSAEIGHYIADLHVPLHASSNHNGQLTGQQGIHGFWESRIPELLSEKEWDFFMDKAFYIRDPLSFCWERLLESGAASDSVLLFERRLSARFPADRKYAFEERNQLLVKQYSSAYSIRYNRVLNGMIERRMRQSVQAVASLWMTAWINAGQPQLRD